MNSHLTLKSFQVLQKLKADEEGEITWEEGAGYWIGNHKVSKAGCEHLLRLCLLRAAYSDNQHKYIVYTASSEVDDVLTDDTYVPAIITAMKTGQPQFPGKPKQKQE